MDEPITWGVRRSYDVAYNSQDEAEWEALEYGGDLILSFDGGKTWWGKAA